MNHHHINAILMMLGRSRKVEHITHKFNLHQHKSTLVKREDNSFKRVSKLAVDDGTSISSASRSSSFIPLCRYSLNRPVPAEVRIANLEFETETVMQIRT